MPSFKAKRISSDIAKYINEILLTEVRDELLKTITITGCNVTSDLGLCKVYFTSISDLDKKTLEKEVNQASSFIRGRLSEKIELRHTPELRFIYDESIEYGNKIEKIIEKIESQNK
mgnify:CR=1 FL=1